MNKVCSIEDCSEEVHEKELCSEHYWGQKTPRRGTKKICSIPDCNNVAKGRGWCLKHYGRWNLFGDPLSNKKPQKDQTVKCKDDQGCVIKRCDNAFFSRGYCRMHFEGLVKYDKLDNIELISTVFFLYGR